MSFSADDIAGMLREYEADYHTGMDLDEMSERLYDYTSGYPFLSVLLVGINYDPKSKEHSCTIERVERD